MGWWWGVGWGGWWVVGGGGWVGGGGGGGGGWGGGGGGGVGWWGGGGWGGWWGVGGGGCGGGGWGWGGGGGVVGGVGGGGWGVVCVCVGGGLKQLIELLMFRGHWQQSAYYIVYQVNCARDIAAIMLLWLSCQFIMVHGMHVPIFSSVIYWSLRFWLLWVFYLERTVLELF